MALSRFKLSKKHWAVILASMVILLVALLIAGLGWVRGTALPSYANATYGRTVARHFDNTFTEANKELSTHGLNHRLTTSAKCGSLGYEGIRATYFCVKVQRSNAGELTPAFIEQWQQRSPELEQNLLAAGWEKTWNERQPIDELFRPRAETVSIGVTYRKEYGKTYCKLAIRHNPAGDNQKAELNSTGECYRTVKFFGGY